MMVIYFAGHTIVFNTFNDYFNLNMQERGLAFSFLQFLRLRNQLRSAEIKPSSLSLPDIYNL